MSKNTKKSGEPPEKEYESYDISYELDYVFDSEKKRYFFFFKYNPSICTNLQLDEDVVAEMITLYANETRPAWTVKQISEHFECDPLIVQAVLRSLSVTHSDVVNQDFVARLTEEGYSDDFIAQSMSDNYQRLSGIKQRFRGKLREAESKKAQKWDLLEQGKLQPFERIINEWKPPATSRTARPTQKQSRAMIDGEVLCVMLSDLHFGDHADEEELFGSPGFDIETVEQRVVEYLEWIRSLVARGRCGTEECHLFSLGDILDSITGFTDKGTKLDTNPKGELLYSRALDSLYGFVEGLTQIFGRVHLHAVKGNHDSVSDWTLMYTISKMLVAEGKLLEEDVNLFRARWGSTTIMDTYILFEHGYSPKHKNKVPRSQVGREAHIGNLMLSDMNALAGDYDRVFLCGDQHHREMTEFKNFDFIRCGAMVNPNHYAHENTWGAVPSQTAFCISDNGVESVYKKRFI